MVSCSVRQWESSLAYRWGVCSLPDTKHLSIFLLVKPYHVLCSGFCTLLSSCFLRWMDKCWTSFLYFCMWLLPARNLCCSLNFWVKPAPQDRKGKLLESTLQHRNAPHKSTFVHFVTRRNSWPYPALSKYPGRGNWSMTDGDGWRAGTCGVEVHGAKQTMQGTTLCFTEMVVVLGENCPVPKPLLKISCSKYRKCRKVCWIFFFLIHR